MCLARFNFTTLNKLLKSILSKSIYCVSASIFYLFYYIVRRKDHILFIFLINLLKSINKMKKEDIRERRG